MTARHKVKNILRIVSRHQVILLLTAVFIVSLVAPDRAGISNQAGMLSSGTKNLVHAGSQLDDPAPDFGIVDSLPPAIAPMPGLLDMVPGASDFRISHMGGSGVTGFYQALETRVAFNTVNKTYLVVWQGDNEGTSKDVIFGQLVDAVNGNTIGPDNFPVAEMTGDAQFDAKHADVVYNSNLNEFLVVWQGVFLATSGALPAEEIFARRVSADGLLLNEDGAVGTATTGMLQISNMGADENDGSFGAFQPAVAFNTDDNEYLLVWHGDDDSDGLVDNEYEIFGQILQLDGGILALKNNRIQISDVAGDNGAADNDAQSPSAVYNEISHEWLVVWHANEFAGDDVEIFGQRLTAQGGNIDNPFHNFRISSPPQVGNEAREPALAWNKKDNEYLVVWCGERRAVANEYEIFARRLNADAGLMDNELRISSMGPDGSINLRAFKPRVSYNPLDNEYMIVWSADDMRGSLVAGEYEIFGQRLNAAGVQAGINDFRISDMGPDGDTRYGAQRPALAYSDSSLNGFLVVWAGDDDAETIDDELEIFGRMIVPFADLAVSITDNITEVRAGSDLTYLITVTNLGPDALRNVSVTDVFPVELTDISWTATGSGGATNFNTAGSGNIGESGIVLPSGATVLYNAHAVVDGETAHNLLLLNTVYAQDMLASDPDLTNNIASDEDTRVTRVADLSMSKTDNVTTVMAGKSLTYIITVSNAGPVTAYKTVVVDSFPEQFAAVSWQASGTGGASGFDTLGTGHIHDDGIILPKDASVIYTALARVDSLVANDVMLSNTAFAYDSVAIDPDTSNNHATDDDTRVVTDVEPPLIAVGDTISLWPPNHKYVTIRLADFNISVYDSVDGIIPVDSVIIDSVWSDEPEDSPGYGHECNDDEYDHDGDDDEYDHDDSDDDEYENDDKGHNDHDGNNWGSGQPGDWVLDEHHGEMDDHGDDGKKKFKNRGRNEHGDKDDDDDHDYKGGKNKWPKGDGNTLNDIVIGDSCKSIDLRAERLGGGNGRVYTIHISVSDRAGNKASTTCYVTVPHDQRGCAAIDDGPAYTVVSSCAQKESSIPPIAETVIQQVAPQQVELFQNYPNPFNPETEIRFQLPETQNVALKIYNLLGQEVRVLTNRPYEAGIHSVKWNGKDSQGRQVASGVYIFQMRAGNIVVNKRLILMR